MLPIFTPRASRLILAACALLTAACALLTAACDEVIEDGAVPIGGACTETPQCVGGALCRDKRCTAVAQGCAADETRACDCDGELGQQVCGADGAFGPCTCSERDATPLDVAVDLGRPVDAAPADVSVDGAVRDAAIDAMLRADADPDANWPPPDFSFDATAPIDASPIQCAPGEVTCLSPRQPASCGEDLRWLGGDRCAGQSECAFGRCIDDPCEVAAMRPSSTGCAFLVVDLPNAAFGATGTTPDAPLGLLVHNPSEVAPAMLWLNAPDGSRADLVSLHAIEVPDLPELDGRYAVTTVQSAVRDADGTTVQGEVEVADGLLVPPGGSATLLLPRDLPELVGSGVRLMAYRLLADRPVTATQTSPYCCNYSFSNDASLLLPVSTLGRRYRFVGVPSFNPAGSNSQPPTMAIVSPTDGTLVDVRLPPGVTVLSDPERTFIAEGSRVQVRLGMHGALLLQAAPGAPDAPTDLTGAEITSTAPVAVFSSHRCANYPYDQTGCDHLEVQLHPRESWGSHFILAPPPRRGNDPAEKVYWKLVADAQVVAVTPLPSFAARAPAPPGYPGETPCMARWDGTVVTLQPGESCVMGGQQAWRLDGDAPFSVLGIISGQQTTGAAMPFGAQAGDPAIFQPAPMARWASAYSFVIPPTVARNHLVVTSLADNPVRLDGALIDLAHAVRVPGDEHVHLTVPVTRGPHHLTGVRPFAAYWVGYDDFVGVAATLGLDLSPRVAP